MKYPKYWNIPLNISYHITLCLLSRRFHTQEFYYVFEIHVCVFDNCITFCQVVFINIKSPISNVLQKFRFVTIHDFAMYFCPAPRTSLWYKYDTMLIVFAVVIVKNMQNDCITLRTDHGSFNQRMHTSWNGYVLNVCLMPQYDHNLPWVWKLLNVLVSRYFDLAQAQKSIINIKILLYHVSPYSYCRALWTYIRELLGNCLPCPFSVVVCGAEPLLSILGSPITNPSGRQTWIYNLVTQYYKEFHI